MLTMEYLGKILMLYERVSLEEEIGGIDVAEYAHTAYTIGQGEFVTQKEFKEYNGNKEKYASALTKTVTG